MPHGRGVPTLSDVLYVVENKEDVAVAFGYNNWYLQFRLPGSATMGKQSVPDAVSHAARE